jgi:hypothetical protein
MPVTVIDPDEYITVEYVRRKSGPVEFELSADRPVRTYILGPRDLERFEKGSKNFEYWGGFPDPRKDQQQKVWVPSGPWYLIISNPSRGESVEVDYDVYW